VSGRYATRLGFRISHRPVSSNKSAAASMAVGVSAGTLGAGGGTLRVPVAEN
jgi:uncharacterized membrane protein YfcA